MVKMMDAATTELLLGITATLATIALAWLKNTMEKKGVSEDQATIVLDYTEDALIELRRALPASKELALALKHLRKLRKMWDDDRVTTDDIKEYLDDLEG
jgi:cyanate permease